MAIRLRVIIVVSFGPWLSFLISTLAGVLVCFLKFPNTSGHGFIVAYIACWSYGVVGGDVDRLFRVRRHGVEFLCSGSIVAAEKA